MRFLIFGGDGMLGHQLFLILRQRHETKVTLRKNLPAYEAYGLFNEGNSYFEVDAKNIDGILNLLVEFKPQVVINAIGLVKQRSDAKDVVSTLEINALFPHKLVSMCQVVNARLIQISTDCVFSGNKGQYIEDDIPDANDLYGQSKHWGEVIASHCLTLRTSIIGLELANKKSLIEWFLMQQGRVQGFTKAIYSGLTTLEMSRLIENLAVNYPKLSGLWHVSSDPISKFDLLCKFAEKLGKNDVEIEPYEGFICNRSLLSSRFKKEINYQLPSWDDMLNELAEQVRKRGENVITK
jgi:dTDP-4-dehydrorhamnose reductase